MYWLSKKGFATKTKKNIIGINTCYRISSRNQ
jgi:hypothetical protein